MSVGVYMLPAVQSIFNALLTDYPQLCSCSESIEHAFNLAVTCYETRGTVLVCGNGGSAADSEHIVGELMKGFMQRRTIPQNERAKFKPEIADRLQGALPAISLVSQSGIITAYANDIDPNMIFAQQVYGYGKPNALLIGISTSGNSANVVNAFEVARGIGMKTWALVGKDGGTLATLGDAVTIAPSQSTPKIQEFHLPIYHAWCAMLEAHFFPEGN